MATERLAGACCRAFVLSSTWQELTRDYEQWQQGKSHRFIDVWAIEWFRPIGEFEVNPVAGTVYEKPEPLFTCTKLDERGRCTVYPSRPDVCRGYPECSTQDHGQCGFLHVCSADWCPFWKGEDDV